MISQYWHHTLFLTHAPQNQCLCEVSLDIEFGVPSFEWKLKFNQWAIFRQQEKNNSDTNWNGLCAPKDLDKKKSWSGSIGKKRRANNSENPFELWDIERKLTMTVDVEFDNNNNRDKKKSHTHKAIVVHVMEN